jgi:multicomponent Na+:H+ antiporter subunit F
MDTFFAYITLTLVMALLIPFYRVFKGPTVFDRLLGAAAVGAKIITVILLLGLMYDRLDMFIDLSMGYAILNFVAVIAMAKYFRPVQRSSK